MTTSMVNEVIETAVGGAIVTKTIEDRESYAIRIRYERNLREQIDELHNLPVVTHSGEVVPLSMLASMQTTWGPGVISSENARLVAHVSFAPSGISGDLETVAKVESSLKESKRSGTLVGSFQNQIEANQRLMVVIPLVICVNLFIIYLQFRSVPIAFTVFSGIPVAFAGGMILLSVNSIEINTAVWIGFIALFGIAVDDGVVMATFLNQVFIRRQPTTVQEVREATIEAGLRRIRPCLMTTVTTIAALLPIVLSTGRGADVAKAMALPVMGGMAVELLTLFVVPVIYSAIKEQQLYSLSDPVEARVEG
jgi:Cu(I)/Ag(I) efflux system membrane protein CusA/SilA